MSCGKTVRQDTNKMSKDRISRNTTQKFNIDTVPKMAIFERVTFPKAPVLSIHVSF